MTRLLVHILPAVRRTEYLVFSFAGIAEVITVTLTIFAPGAVIVEIAAVKSLTAFGLAGFVIVAAAIGWTVILRLRTHDVALAVIVATAIGRAFPRLARAVSDTAIALGVLPIFAKPPFAYTVIIKRGRRRAVCRTVFRILGPCVITIDVKPVICVLSNRARPALTVMVSADRLIGVITFERIKYIAIIRIKFIGRSRTITGAVS